MPIGDSGYAAMAWQTWPHFGPAEHGASISQAELPDAYGGYAETVWVLISLILLRSCGDLAGLALRGIAVTAPRGLTADAASGRTTRGLTS